MAHYKTYISNESNGGTEEQKKHKTHRKAIANKADIYPSDKQ